jgi:hypothetical protein
MTVLAVISFAVAAIIGGSTPIWSNFNVDQNPFNIIYLSSNWAIHSFSGYKAMRFVALASDVNASGENENGADKEDKQEDSKKDTEKDGEGSDRLWNAPKLG